MPEPGWNPYRWVSVADTPVTRATLQYHHRLQGLSGRFDCTLEALTPLLVGDGKGRFVGLSGSRQEPVIPATSLKGAFRALAELVGNAAVPFEKGLADAGHQFREAGQGEGPSWSLDTVARTFGYLNKGQVFAGLVRFSDAEWVKTPDRPQQWRGMPVVGGQPKIEHTPFYPQARNARKFYHHKTEAAELTRPQGNIPAGSIRTVHPAPPGTSFRFRLDFVNLRQEELELLTYVLILEPDVEVTLSTAALGPDFTDSLTLRGPMRHKIGGGKPLGGGSVHVRVERLTLRTDPAARYRQGRDPAEILVGDALDARLALLTQSFIRRTEPTMPRTFRELRAMLIYAADDPRPTDLDYPSYAWFQEDRLRPLNEKERLKPTL
jgi:CRISPR/Cas system CSM-associated protein Csm3 (group 7 of RAMP superfamily)